MEPAISAQNLGRLSDNLRGVGLDQLGILQIVVAKGNTLGVTVAWLVLSYVLIKILFVSFYVTDLHCVTAQTLSVWLRLCYNVQVLLHVCALWTEVKCMGLFDLY